MVFRVYVSTFSDCALSVLNGTLRTMVDAGKAMLALPFPDRFLFDLIHIDALNRADAGTEAAAIAGLGYREILGVRRKVPK